MDTSHRLRSFSPAEDSYMNRWSEFHDHDQSRAAIKLPDVGKTKGTIMRSVLTALLLTGILLAVTARNAAADTFDMTWAGGYGPGSAVLTATNEGGGNYLVTGVS